jgi:hypothetical protein
MKKTLLLLAFITTTCAAVTAQITVPKTSGATGAIQNFIKPPSIGDVGGTTSGIVDMLSSKLTLPAAQKPKLTEAITGFLTNKKGILGLAESNPAGYLSKFNPLQSGLFSKLKGIMGAAKFASFLKLKPTGNNIAGNALSNLFF